MKECANSSDVALHLMQQVLFDLGLVVLFSSLQVTGASGDF